MSFDPLLKAADLPEPFQITPLDGGANNRVYKFAFSSRPPLVCKQYFQDPNDLRQRLQAEYSFLKYAWDVGIRNIPEPLFAHKESNTALYSFLTGHRIEEVTDAMVAQGVAFFLKLNREKEKGIHLLRGSESCMSLSEYLEVTEKRIERLQEAQVEPLLQSELDAFLSSSLYPKWEKLKEKTCKAALHLGISLNEALDQKDLCISPSDFGFHNALLEENGTVTFIDFEYAGWDDPCKTVCDFFCQPRIPISHHYFETVSEAMASVTTKPEKCLERIKMIFPVMQMKWCCILLNVFTQVGKNRRLFSLSEKIERQEKQLKLAKALLNQI